MLVIYQAGKDVNYDAALGGQSSEISHSAEKGAAGTI
jgi:hypothetical protein